MCTCPIPFFPNPRCGVARKGSPRFVPMWGREKGVTPICSDSPGIPRFAPISSDFLRFLSEQIRTISGKPLSANPFGKSPTFIIPCFFLRVTFFFSKEARKEDQVCDVFAPCHPDAARLATLRPRPSTVQIGHVCQLIPHLYRISF